MERKKTNDFIEYLKKYYSEEEIQEIILGLVHEKKLCRPLVEELNNLGYDLDVQNISFENSYGINLSEISSLLASFENNESAYLPIENLDLTLRSYNCLARANIKTISDLCKLTKDELRCLRGLGQKSYIEILLAMKSNGFKFKSELYEEESITIPDKYNSKSEIKIEDLELSIRSYNCLRRAGIDTVGQICNLTDLELMRIKNLGQKSIKEIKAKLDQLGLCLVCGEKNNDFFDDEDYDDNNDDDELNENHIEMFENQKANNDIQIDEKESNESTNDEKEKKYETDFLKFYNSIRK